MRQQKEFFEKYNIKEEAYAETELSWEDLLKIHSDYLKFKEELEPSAVFIFNTIMKFPFVHSVRYRLKDPEHLIEKIIRRKIEDKNSNITLENYKEEVTDLIGLRALHLFKEEWGYIHDNIMKMWTLKQPPIANFRKGDTDSIIQVFKDKGCEAKEHKYGYRSIHYLIETQPAKTKFYAEIQVRTIYEEAWSEIDHTIRYPYDLDNPIFFQFLSILNRLSGGADEMGSFVKFLKRELTKKEKDYQTQLDEKNNLIQNLEEKIGKLNLKEEELNSVKQDLDKLKNQRVNSPARRSTLIDAYLRSQNIIEKNKIFNDTLKKMEESTKVMEMIKNMKPPNIE
jgi:ppGpp synthetase/RelA/SpoT-type nucleotidyltranferase